jgi:hypothetical protein
MRTQDTFPLEEKASCIEPFTRSLLRLSIGPRWKTATCFIELRWSSGCRLCGNAYPPLGFEDCVHVRQRSGGILGGYVPTLLVAYADGNLISEFKPELRHLGHRLHQPRLAQ